MTWVGAIVGGGAGALVAAFALHVVGASQAVAPTAIAATFGALVGGAWRRVLEVVGDVLFTPTDSF